MKVIINNTSATYTYNEAITAVRSARVTISRFKDCVEWLESYHRNLADSGIKVDFPLLLGFNPEKELKEESRRLRRAEKAVQAWAKGTMKNPQISYTMTGRALDYVTKQLQQWCDDIDMVNERIEDTLKSERSRDRAEWAYTMANDAWTVKHPPILVSLS